MRGNVMWALAVVLAGALTSVAYAAAHLSKPLAASAAEVIDRNVAARGGLEAWRKVNAMMWLGHLERGGRTDGPHIPFVMQLERPNRTRFEIKEQYNQFTRIFDGSHGWKVRPGNNGQPDMKAFSKQEVDYARDEFAIDGPLLDYKAKGVTAELDGLDTLDGRKAYRLSLKLASGTARKVWVDVETNLEVRYDRPATSPLAPGAPVSLYYDGYKTVDGLKIPVSLETSSGPNGSVRENGDKLVIDRVIVNPKLEAQTFLPPPMPMRRGGKVLIPGNGAPSAAPPGALGRPSS
jgi:outer membrane lipoprotein-sorting protein